MISEEQNADKLGKLCSERKTNGRKWLCTFVYQADECALNIY